MKKPSNSSAPARIYLVDDHPLLRKGVSAVINAAEGLCVCGEAGTVAETLLGIEKTRPDLVVLDISLPGSGGVDLIRDIKLRLPRIRVLILSMHDERLYAERALRAGATGYVMKQDPPERLIDGIRKVLGGEMFVSPEVAGTLLHAFVSGAKQTNEKVGVARLSDRELQVFEAIGNGCTTREIAGNLNLGVKTVETYRSNIKSKLGLANGAALTHAAIHWVEEEATSNNDNSDCDPRAD